MNTSSKQDYTKIIHTECEIQKIDADLFCAIVNAESAWNPDAMRFEKNFGYLWQPQKFAELEHITSDTETVLQKMSYGLCQIMGANARWIAWKLPLMKLLDPVNNIKTGVEFFRRRCNLYEDIKDKISSWNAGSPIKKDDVYINHDYVEKVYSYYCALKESKT